MMTLRARYLKLRKRIIPWCIKPGCWGRSHVGPKRVIRGRQWGGRGNVCATHLLEALMSNLEETVHGAQRFP